MQNTELSGIFNEGNVCKGEASVAIKELPWAEHPSFKGVHMKHLLSGQQTAGSLSCHLVRIDPNCEIGNHIHDGKVEVHTVLAGLGGCELDGKWVPYEQGTISIIPSAAPHKVMAGQFGLYLYAKFSPALV